MGLYEDVVPKSVQDFIKDVKSFFNDTESPQYYPHPNSVNDANNPLVTKIVSTNWNKITPYSFKVIDKTNNKALGNDKNSGISGTFADFSEFKLQINPQELQLDTNFAINITPTQDGIVSEHNGIVLRDLVISGTTGVHPLRGAGGASKDGKVIAGVEARSGYEEFLLLKNYLTAYALYKKNNKNAETKDAILVFINRKDNETLIVEPTRFSMKRSKDKSTLYYYNISFKVLGNFTPTEKPENDNNIWTKVGDALATVNDTLSKGRSVLLKGADLLNQIEREIENTIYEPLRQVDLLIKTTAGIQTQLGDMSQSLIASLNASETLQRLQKLDQAAKNGLTAGVAGISLVGFPINMVAASKAGGKALLDLKVNNGDILNQLNEDEKSLPSNLAIMFAKEKSDVKNMSPAFVEQLKNDVIRIRDNATEAFGLGDSIYNQYANRTQTFVPSPAKQTTNKEFEILQGFMDIEKALNIILAYRRDIFDSSLEAQFKAAENSFNNQIKIPFPNSVNEVFVTPGGTLEQLAFQYLGDMTRWVEIAKLNDLVPPYIAETSTNKRIRAYGDKILIPNTKSPSVSNIKVTKENKYNKNMTELEKRFGIDIKLTNDFDFVINNAQDIDLIANGKNVGQAIKIKFKLEKGDLKYHKEIGIGNIVGEKVTHVDVLYDEIINTFLQDPRFEKVENLNIELLNGNTVIINLNLFVKDVATPVPLKIGL